MSTAAPMALDAPPARRAAAGPPVPAALAEVARGVVDLERATHRTLDRLRDLRAARYDHLVHHAYEHVAAGLTEGCPVRPRPAPRGAGRAPRPRPPPSSPSTARSTSRRRPRATRRTPTPTTPRCAARSPRAASGPATVSRW